jgi:hypothetical protein
VKQERDEDIGIGVRRLEPSLHQLHVARIHDQLNAGGINLLQRGVLLEDRVSSPLVLTNTREIGFRIEFDLHLLTECGRYEKASGKDAG